jgi:succinate dehydrogenase flavin-adding protein (antitoxin of CptAB toxin-antitoxin module)
MWRAALRPTAALDTAGSLTRAQRWARARHRCGQRGLKELDLVLGAWTRSPVFAQLQDRHLDQLEALLREEVPDLLLWTLSEREDAAPEQYRDQDHVLMSIRSFVKAGGAAPVAGQVDPRRS